MGGLFDFIYQRRELIIFLVLEVVSIFFLFNYNARYGTDFFQAKNEVTGTVSNFIDGMYDYFQLQTINDELLTENQQLKELLYQYQTDSLRKVSSDSSYGFHVKGIHVNSSTFNRDQNYIGLNGGKSSGLDKGMGVISSSGVVGIVQASSKNYATVYSLLHPNLLISGQVKRLKTSCTVQWDQASYLHSTARYIPRHTALQIGDSIVTSGFSAIFPAGILIGIVEDIVLEDYMTFYDVKIRLATDFTALDYVYVLDDIGKLEKDSLQL